MQGLSGIRNDAYDRVSRSQFYRDNLAGLTAHQRHQRLLAQLPGELQPGSTAAAAAAAAAGANTVTDEDVLRQHHRFLRGPGDDDADAQAPDSWGARLARRYYDRLFKEFAIADLSRHREAKVGLRWRTKAEVLAGKGQFVCGAKGCEAADGLASYEVNFAYAEAGQAKAALVKLRLCQACAAKLNYRKEKQYRRLGRSPLEQDDDQQQQQQQEQARQGRGDKRGRRHKQRDRSARSASASDDSASEGSAGGNERHRRRGMAGGGSSKRARLGRSGEHEGPSRALCDADIDAWLDNMFTAS